MDFRIIGLEEGQFRHLFSKDQEYLAKRGIERIVVDSNPGYPCRVSLRDVEIGETVLLMNFEHQPAKSPYRSSHAIFVDENTSEAILGKNEVPEMLEIRFLSVRAFDDEGNMVDADVVDGHQLQPVIDRMLSIGTVSCLHLHNAKRGCFMARVERA